MKIVQKCKDLKLDLCCVGEKDDEMTLPPVQTLQSLVLDSSQFRFKIAGENRLQLTSLKVKFAKYSSFGNYINPAILKCLSLRNNDNEEMNILMSMGKQLVSLKRLELRDFYRN